MPSMSLPMIATFHDMDLSVASVLSALSLLGFPLVLFGATPPILVGALSEPGQAGLA